MLPYNLLCAGHTKGIQMRGGQRDNLTDRPAAVLVLQYRCYLGQFLGTAATEPSHDKFNAIVVILSQLASSTSFYRRTLACHQSLICYDRSDILATVVETRERCVRRRDGESDEIVRHCLKHDDIGPRQDSEARVDIFQAPDKVVINPSSAE